MKSKKQFKIFIILFIIIINIFAIKETLINEYQNNGIHSIVWNAENQISGIYFYKITAGIQTQTGKCLLVK